MKYTLLGILGISLLITGCSPKPLSDDLASAPQDFDEVLELDEDEGDVTRLGEGSDQVVIAATLLSDTNELQISGSMPGYWYFEATAPVVVLDNDGQIVAEGYITATDDWMTTQIVPYEGTISLSINDDPSSLIIRRNNVSGMVENDGYVEVLLSDVIGDDA